jgi:dihydropteroate synthase
VRVRPRARFQLRLPGGRTLRLGERTLLMAIVNVTPDSFADGGARFDADRAVEDALHMETLGADLIDVGGESTRPGSEPLPAAEELARVTPVVRALGRRLRIPFSIDTYKAAVAEAALDAGASIVNDVSALSYDPALGGVVARRGAGIVLMHTRGRPRDMYREAEYGDVVADVRRELHERLASARMAGIPDECILVDPGIGFGKRAEHSSTLIARLHELASLGRPLLAGPSRKSFLQRSIGERSPSQREFGSAAAVTACVLAGVHVVRVHGVAEMLDVIRVADMLRRDAGLDGESTWSG